MTVVNYPANSPYSSTPQTSWYLSNIVWKDIPPNSADQLFLLTPRHKYRPDTISYDLYSTPAYWWVFCVRNPFMRKDPIWTCVPGIQIWVPSGSYLRQIVG